MSTNDYIRQSAQKISLTEGNGRLNGEREGK